MSLRLNRRIPLFAFFPALLAAAAASPTSSIARLPNVQINAAKVDASGNIYLAGQTTTSTGPASAYIARLSPNGASLYSITIAGSAATALDIDSSGAVYVAGTTTATSFPVTPGTAASPGATAFAAKLDTRGNILYAALIGGNANTVPGSVAVNTQGELVVSGQSTPSASDFAAAFLLKLSADGAQVVNGPQGIGGLLALDPQGNIDVAGVPPYGSTLPPATPGAFESMPASSYCGCPFLSYPCGGNQYVASLTADLSQIRFLTYLTAHYGAVPASISIDAQGNILLAGTTYAPAYPTTPGSYQPNYTAASGIVETCGPPIPMEYTSASGYVSSLKPDGSGLLFSTFFSGTNSDTVTFGALTSAGIYLAGQAGSVDLPGFNGAVPSPCIPDGFVARMTADGSAISSSATPPGTPLAYDSTTGTLLLVSANNLLRFDPSQPTPIACVLDAADLSPVTAVAPGELLSTFGRFEYFGTNPLASALSPINGSFPVGSQMLNVAAGQTPAPLLYVSQQQINFQAPYEIAADPQTTLAVTYTDVNGNSDSDFRTLNVVAGNPVAFLTQPRASIVNQTLPVLLNADGTINSVANPAAAGSVVILFLDGLGVTSPPPVTGLVNTSPPVPLSLPLTVAPDCSGTFCYPAPSFVSASSVVGSISGVTQVQLLAPANSHPGYPLQVIFSLSVGPTPIRDMDLSFWAQ